MPDGSNTVAVYEIEHVAMPAELDGQRQLMPVASTGQLQPVNGKAVSGRPFPKGQSGNPLGRPKGSRNRITELFIAAMRDDFASHGADAIASVRARDPAAYLGIVRSMVPPEMLLANNAKPDTLDFAELSDGEFADALDEGEAAPQAFVQARRKQAVEMAAAGKAGSVREALRMLGADV